jgi:hypothetical protein
MSVPPSESDSVTPCSCPFPEAVCHSESLPLVPDAPTGSGTTMALQYESKAAASVWTTGLGDNCICMVQQFVVPTERVGICRLVCKAWAKVSRMHTSWGVSSSLRIDRIFVLHVENYIGHGDPDIDLQLLRIHSMWDSLLGLQRLTINPDCWNVNRCAHIWRVHSLTYLDVSYNNIIQSESQLQEWGRMGNLRVLNLGFCSGVTRYSLKFLQSPMYDKLLALTIPASAWDDELMEYITAYSSSSLTYFSVTENGVYSSFDPWLTTKGWRLFGTLHNITSIHLDTKVCRDLLDEELQQLNSLTKLTYINLITYFGRYYSPHTPYSGHYITSLLQFAACNSLKSLYITNNQLLSGISFLSHHTHKCHCHTNTMSCTVCVSHIHTYIHTHCDTYTHCDTHTHIHTHCDTRTPYTITR